MRLDWDNELQPDAVLLLERKFGGQTVIGTDDFIESAPELIAEIASCGTSIELHKKFHVYRCNGVREYLVWRVLDREFDWFVLRDGEFHKQAPNGEGILRNTIFPGLWFDAAALLEGKLSQVLAVLDRGIKSPEHAAFVAKLAGE